MAQLPFELVEIIISEFWYSEHPTANRIAFMTGCPRICCLWRDVYASITPRDIYVPSIRYLFYLSSIIRSKKSSIYRPFLSKSTRTITCHVDLIESNLNNDPAMFAYIMFCHMPNFAGIRKCFPNIQYIHLEIKVLPGIFRPRGVDDQLIRTQVSIKLDQAKTRLGLSVFPVDWCITIDDPPDIDEVDPHKLKKRWSSFLLTDFLRDMHQSSWMLRDIWISIESYMSAAEGSTCSNSARHFRHRSYCEEEFGDLWGINHRFWKAARPPVTWNVKIIFSLIHDLFWLNCADVELPMWRRCCSAELGFRGPRVRGENFTVKHGTVTVVETPEIRIFSKLARRIEIRCSDDFNGP